MDPIARMVAAGAAGVSGSSATYVDDVFSTFLYEGTGAAHTITNGIDLSGEGGLVWIKNRQLSGGLNHSLYDTERGVLRQLVSNSTSGQGGASGNDLDGFNSDGFSLGTDTYSIVNADGYDYASWTFRKAPGFFDIVTYTGNSSNRTIAHNLGSVPGMIIIKQYDATRQWFVYHRSLGATYSLNLDSNAGKQLGSTIWNNTEPTATHFSLGTSAGLNNNNNQYIAYIFAHDDQSFGTDEDEAIIKCGQFEATDGTEVNLGFEPQWLLVKRVDGSRDWFLIDNMRGMSATSTSNSQYLRPNSNSDETSNRNIFLTPTGFTVADTTAFNYDTHIYMAIRRPHKPPTAGTEVFAIDNQGTGTMPPQYHSGFPVDMAFNVAFGESQAYLYRDNYSRINPNRLKFNTTDSETSISQSNFDYMNGWHANNSSVSTTYSWMFKRAPGFFDVVTYAGNGSARTIPHNLEAVPQMFIVKRRDSTPHWQHWYYSLGAGGLIQSAGTTPGGAATTRPHWNNTLPTATHFSVGTDNDVNNSSGRYIAYLFGSLDGISKVGEYTGTGSNVNVDCGFSNGARFVMIKRRDGSGDFYIWDSLRGIVSGNDPYFILNSNATEVTNTDYIDPLSSGFTVTSNAPAELNANGGTYLFLAIA